MTRSSGFIPERTDILGIDVSAINMEMALEAIDQWVAERKQHYICITGVHGVIESQSDPDLRRILNEAGLVTPDGMPLVWVSRMKKRPHVSRVYGPDLMRETCRKSVAKGYRHFLYGGGEGVPERLAKELQRSFPGIHIVGQYSPPFRPLTPSEDAAIVKQINESEADIVWIGLSTPKQEFWMAAHAGQLNAPVMVGVGAAFDFLAGLKPQAPHWMQRSGLEWLYRLVTEPRRLWRRYFKIIPLFLFYMTLDLLNMRNSEELRNRIASQK
jgi:N-acetylglucosaminyldiphosphoundecaprenol N-acetyl-beta-D-mannosaminyltransferase